MEVVPIYFDCDAFALFFLALAVACACGVHIPYRNPGIMHAVAIIGVVLAVIAAILSLAC